MGNRFNFAPRWPTILVAAVLTVIGALGTFGGMLPSVAGQTSEALGVWAFVASAVVLMLGILIEGI